MQNQTYPTKPSLANQGYWTTPTKQKEPSHLKTTGWSNQRLGAIGPRNDQKGMTDFSLIYKYIEPYFQCEDHLSRAGCFSREEPLA